MDRHLGRFRVTREMVDDNLAKFVYRDLIPLEVRYAFDFDGFEVLAIGSQFAEVAQGCDAPRYMIEFEYGPEEKHFDAKGFLCGGRTPIIGCRFIKGP